MEKKILVTGGAGYIGSHVIVRLHEEGFQPILLDNFSNSEKSVLDGLQTITGQHFPCYAGDVLDEKLLDEIFTTHHIQGVIHFAAKKAVGESVEKPLSYYKNNVSGLVTLLEAMMSHGVRQLVFSSSCTVYGQPDELPVTEASPKKPANSPYGNTKQIGEEIIEDTVKSGQRLQSIALRYFNPIGAHPSGAIGELPLGVPNNLVPFITQTAAGLRKELTVFGNDYHTPDGTCIRDYIHVMDLADAHVECLKHLDTNHDDQHFDVINVGTGQGSTVLEAIQSFEKVTGQKLPYALGPRRPGDVEKVYAAAKKAKEVLQWEAQLTLDDAMRDAWHWQQKISGKGLG